MASNFSVRHLSQTNKWNKTHGKFHCTKKQAFFETNCTQLTTSNLLLLAPQMMSLIFYDVGK